MLRLGFLITIFLITMCCVQEPEDENDNALPSGTEAASADSSVEESQNLSLYSKYCESCHGEISESERLGSLPSDIIGAIENQSQMKHLSVLTEDQIDEISEALNKNYD